LRTLPSFEAVRPRLVEAAHYYAELQTFKHYASGKREEACDAWYGRNAERFPGLHWWEFAAACGSSLPVFAMIYLATQPGVDARDVRATFDAYFPNISAVHILLDYFIDQAEDREHRELNFVACYPSVTEAVERVRKLLRATLVRVRTLATSETHEFLVRAMCLFYLSHPKVFEQRLDTESAVLLSEFG
jgi:tetraprenyl-beta-curcumene synthase